MASQKFVAEGVLIFQAGRVGERLAKRAQRARGRAVVTLSRDELEEVAAHLMAVATIAERYHIIQASVGSLAPDAFPAPAE